MLNTFDVTIAGDLEQLEPMARSVEELLESHGISSDVVFQVNLCLDESITNAVRYGGADSVRVRLTVEEGNVLEILVSDNGAAYDPLKASEPDLESDIENRPIGGLGIHLVRTFMNEVTYKRDGDLNVLTLRKLPPAADPNSD